MTRERGSLAERIVALIDEETDELCPEDTFAEAGAAILVAIDALDSRYAAHAFREGIRDLIPRNERTH